MDFINYVKSGNINGVLSELKNINIIEDTFPLQLTDECSIPCSGLQHAVIANQLAVVQTLLQHGANPTDLEKPSIQGQCSLSLESLDNTESGILRVTNKQLEHDRFFSAAYLEAALVEKSECPITRNPLNHIHLKLLPTYYSPLTMAARLGHVDVFNTLVEKSSPNYQLLTCIAIIHQQPSIIESIKLKLGATELSQQLSELLFENTPLYQALLNNHMYNELSLMLEYITSIEHLNGDTALSFALRSQNLDLISKVLMFDSRLNVQLPSGETPINIALSGQNMSIDQIETLLCELSQYTPKDVLFQSIPIDRIVQCYKHKHNASSLELPMLVYSYFNNHLLISEYLLHHGYDINELKGGNFKWFPLLGALEGSTPQLETLNAILDHPNINVNVSTEQGKTALMASFLRCLPWAAERLLQVETIDVDFISITGETALIIAINNNVDSYLIKKLIDCGANVNLSSKGFKSPLINAVKHKNIEVINILLENGATLKQTHTLDVTKQSLEKLILQEMERQNYLQPINAFLKENQHTGISKVLTRKIKSKKVMALVEERVAPINSEGIAGSAVQARPRSTGRKAKWLGKLFKRFR